MPMFVQEVYGPMFIGVTLNIMLYGVMSAQTYLYFSMYKDDRTWIKVFVLVLFLCDTANTGFDIAFVYDPLVNHFGSLSALTEATWNVFAFNESANMSVVPLDPAITAIIAALVQLFFAWRVKVLTSNRRIVGVIVLCSVTQLLGGLGVTIALGMVPQFYEFRKFRVIGIIWLVAAALADMLITAALVWHLRKHKTGMSVTDDLISKIIRFTVQTGLITALFAMINLALYLTIPSGYDLIFNIPLAKLYTNSLMSTLNSRRIWKAAANHSSESLGHSAQRSMVNVNVLHSDADGRRSIRASERIAFSMESHQMTDFADMKDKVYPSNTASFVPQSAMSLSAV
ncbi:hypothetical protein GSI_02430 [Ganoderma sinense ZZ0214-1]|uniref:DUF6534 domain-containing protein n=1 Tax=Ganoderma sinense ZZ0214-1 TaxID=1077348 RepID=A0A2G8SPL6_9APHY|nr:hypothetical protein GSI_02430 [Ganoderma sinense ZZ0214-1]